MEIKRKYFIVEYNEKISYIPEVVEYLETKMKEIMDFFNIDSISPRKIIIYDDLELYKKHFEQFAEYRDYVCADTNDGNINLLSLEAAHKTRTHHNMTLNELKTTILHEFVHICQQEVEKEHIEPEIIWFWEALATNLGNPNMFHRININANDNEINNFAKLKDNYLVAFTIGNYMLEKINHERILEYIKYPSKLLNDSTKILEDVKNWSKK